MIEEKIKNKIRLLPAVTINRIAAGEVVERPSSVVKELLENALDAGSTEITIKIETGGQNLISISDNGCGMSKDDLLLAIQRHTTSKLQDDNLLDINYFGFRGEALPSIASVSRMTIKTATKSSEEGWAITVAGGEITDSSPIPKNQGTTIEICDLFFATPARLKFLRSEKVETQHIIDMVKRIALANPKVKLSLYSEEKLVCNYPAATDENPMFTRMSQVFNKDFYENSLKVSNTHQEIIVEGYISLPTYDRVNSNEYYTYVNGRPVKDKLLMATIRAAYQDFLSKDRYPMVVLFLTIPNQFVDVNVHPSKTEVRFRDPQLIRGILISGLKNALQGGSQKTSSTIAQDALENIQIFNQPKFRPTPKATNYTSASYNLSSPKPIQKINESILQFHEPVTKSFIDTKIVEQHQEDFPLGTTRCQLHETYIVAQTKDSIIIVDQHAAHERLIYESLKNNDHPLDKQRLLLPEIIETSEETVEKILLAKDLLDKIGITLNKCTNQSVILTEIPHALGKENVKKLAQDLVDEFQESEPTDIKEKLNHKLATYACHHSIRSGRKMNIEEMNKLLRDMEKTPYSGQCNHGRPTYIELKLKDIEKLFGRT
jgi:DNA mismatch repair protein MutL